MIDIAAVDRYNHFVKADAEAADEPMIDISNEDVKIAGGGTMACAVVNEIGSA